MNDKKSEDQISNSFDGTRLKEARKRKGWTQLDLASKIEMRVATISNAETGKVVPTSTTVSLFALALGVTPRFFYRTDLSLKECREDFGEWEHSLSLIHI